MSEERFNEIIDSVNFQLKICKHLRADDELLQEEKELLDYTILLRKENEALKEKLLNKGDNNE